MIYMEKLEVKRVDWEKRKFYLISMAIDLHEILEQIIRNERIVTERGAKYPLSYLIEDMIMWIIKDPKRYKQFIEETYEETEI